MLIKAENHVCMFRSMVNLSESVHLKASNHGMIVILSNSLSFETSISD
jgi:hypothetical protein